MGTTSEKLVYLNDTKLLIRNKLNKFGAELTNENTFRSYATFLEDLYNDYPTVSDAGSNVTLNNTKKAPLKKLDLNSTELTQDGTPTLDNPVDVNVITGSNNINITNTRNLFDLNNITVGKLGAAGTVTVDGDVITFTANNQSVYAIEIDLNDLNLKPNTTYTVSNLYENTGSFAVSSGWRYYNGSSYTSLPGGKTYFNFTTGDGTTNKLYFYLGSPTTYTGTLTLYNIQLLEGEILESDIPTYIPYSQKSEQNYPITLSSKNSFNINGDVNTRYNGQIGNYNTVIDNDLTSTYTNNDGYPYGQRIYVGVGKTVTISAKVKSFVPSNRVGSVGRILVFNDNTSSGVSYVTYNNDETEIKTLTFTPTTDYICVCFSFVAPTSQQSSVTFTDIQVEYGETATNYMPYIANPLEYCKIGDYADQIFKNTTNSPYYDNTLLENEWYLKKNIEKRIFDGSETNWLKDGNSYKINQSDMLTANVGNGLCNYFKNSRIDYSYTAGHIRFGWSNTYIYFYVDTENIADVNAWQDWLSTHNTKVYYQLATPQYIHISETDYPILRNQLDNLYNNAKSYNGQTNITQTNDDLPFNIELSALMKGE